jgi:hypothetical protein
METAELQDLADDLAAIQPFLGRLTGDFSLRGLMQLLQDAVQARRDGEVIDLDPLLARVDAAARAVAAGQPHVLSWRDLILGEGGAYQAQREYIVIKPQLDYASILPAAEALDVIRDQARSIIAAEPDVRVRLTGSAALETEELASVSRGTGLAAVLSIIAVTIILIAGLKSVSLVIATLITLICGLILTTGMAILTVGELNLISIAFAVLYIGLGVAYAIHFCLRYREFRANNADNEHALRLTGIDMGKSLFLCAVTTAIGFYAFMPTDYRGVAELGWISGTGMFISLAITLTLLPALLTLFPIAPGGAESNRAVSWLRRFSSFPARHARAVVIASALLALAALALVPQLHFDYNTLNLQDPDNESVQTYRELLQDSDNSPWTGIVLVRSEPEARQMTARISALPLVEKVIGAWDFVPDDQAEKLAIIEEINLLLAGALNLQQNNPPTDIERRQALASFLEFLDRTGVSRETEPALATLAGSLRDLEQRAERDGAILRTLEQSLLKTLPGRLAALREALAAQPVEIADLPQELLRRWVSPDGWYRLEVFPRENLNDNQAARAFVEELRSVAPQAVGSPIVRLEASAAVVRAFQEAFLGALVAISLLLVALLRSLRDSVLALIPLLLAALLTGAASVLFDIPFNFANVVALPLLLGVGVDNGIHLLHRHRRAPPADGLLLNTSTTRAIIVSGLTTIGSIGNLALSHHLGTASMGKLLTIGIGMTFLTTLILLPSLLALEQKRQQSQPPAWGA